jgi:hypothetical protein
VPQPFTLIAVGNRDTEIIPRPDLSFPFIFFHRPHNDSGCSGGAAPLRAELPKNPCLCWLSAWPVQWSERSAPFAFSDRRWAATTCGSRFQAGDSLKPMGGIRPRSIIDWAKNNPMLARSSEYRLAGSVEEAVL